MKIKITSPCMAMLLYEVNKSNGQAEGCLCGEINTESFQEITDSCVTTSTEDVLSVNCLSNNPEEASNPALKSSSKILGRYKFCRRPKFTLTVKEKSQHRKLIKSMEHSGRNGALAITMLIQETWVERHSNYSWQFIAFSSKNGKFMPTQVEIVNLKAVTCGVYKPYPTIHQQVLTPQATASYDTLKKRCLNSKNQHGSHMVDATREMTSSFVTSLENCARSLQNTELLLDAAFAEKQRLKQRLIDLQAQKLEPLALSENVKSLSVQEMSSSSECDSTSADEEFPESQFVASRVDHNSSHRSNAVFEPIDDIDSVPLSIQKIEDHTTEKGHTAVEKDDKSDPFGSLVNMAMADLKKNDLKNPKPSPVVPNAGKPKPSQFADKSTHQDHNKKWSNCKEEK